MQSSAADKSFQSCPTLCDPIDSSPPGSSIPAILQARILEWVAMSYSNAWKWKVKVKSLSRVWLLATPGTAAYQAPPSMGFSRQEVISTIWFQNTTPGRIFVPISSHSRSLIPPDTGIPSSVLCLCGCDGSGRFLEIGSAHIWLFVPVFFRLVASLHGVSPYQLSTTPYGHLIGCSAIPHILLIHSSFEWLFWKHFGYFHFLALINDAGMSTHVLELYCS